MTRQWVAKDGVAQRAPRRGLRRLRPQLRRRAAGAFGERLHLEPDDLGVDLNAAGKGAEAAVDAGLGKLGGDLSDKDKFMATLKAVSLADTPRGPLKFDHLNNAVGNVYVRRLGREGAKYGLTLWNKTIKTYENVSQFWTWPESEFLAHPVYTRDYPPLTKC